MWSSSLNELRDIQCLEAFLAYDKHSINVIAIVVIICVPCLSLGLIIPAFSRSVDLWVLKIYIMYNKEKK